MGFGKLAVIATWLICAGAAAWPSVTQTSGVHGVTVAVTPGNLEADSGIWDFAIAFEGGSKRLDDEVLDDVVLVAEGVRLKPLAWEGQPRGVTGYRAGVLMFVAIHPRPKELQLQITRRGEGRPRVFTFVFGDWSA